jgi:hypothetical protein
MTTSLDSLPNELWLLFMRFLSPIDLYRALTGLNSRINSLLTVMIPRPMIGISQYGSTCIRFADMRELIEGQHYWAKCLLSAIDTIYLRDTLVTDVLCHRFSFLFTLPSMKTPLSVLFPSLCRLYITQEVINRNDILQMVLSMKDSLRYLHLAFETYSPFSKYTKIINAFIQHKLSFYSMIFDIRDGKFLTFFCIFYPLFDLLAF